MELATTNLTLGAYHLELAAIVIVHLELQICEAFLLDYCIYFCAGTRPVSIAISDGDCATTMSRCPAIGAWLVIEAKNTLFYTQAFIDLISYD